MRKRSGLLTLVFLLAAQSAWACRFWVGVGPHVSDQTIAQELLGSEKSLKNLGKEYADGWSVGYYENQVPLIFRGAWPAVSDPNFDRAVTDVAEMEPQIVFAHLRRASSGCSTGIADPHPFERPQDGKTWVFAHNGGMDKNLLMRLIGEEGMLRTPPRVCNENPPDSWVDSELYFIYLLAQIKAAKGDVVLGLQRALGTLSSEIDEGKRYLNFFLSDGEKVWAFREGETLFYRYDEIQGASFVSSEILSEYPQGWMEFPEGAITELMPSQPMKFFNLKQGVESKS